MRNFYDILQKGNISKDSAWILSYMIITTSVYLFSECIQIFISNSNEDKITMMSYVYNLLFTWASTYILMKQGNIYKKKYPDTITYFIGCHAGSLVFALLGQVPSLKNIVIVWNFWNNLTLGAIFTVISFTVLILYLVILQLKKACRDHVFCIHMKDIMKFVSLYLLLLVIIGLNNANHVHVHVHHAIFSGLLSLWFTDWDNTKKDYSMQIHSILIGIVIEGINFYGISEYFLFIFDNTVFVTINYSLLIWGIYLLCVMCLYLIDKYITGKKKQVLAH